ncbi:hypothetical protein CDEF62S_01250 [Castellaniella defragrans]
MVRILGAALLAGMLAGCTTPADRAWWRAVAGLPPVPGQFSFDWRMTGDSSLAPLQVFDDGRQTWLQYPADQAVPAVFERTASGDRLLRPRREGDYLVVAGVPARLVLRGGHLQAEAWRSEGGGDQPGEAGDDTVSPPVVGAEAGPSTGRPMDGAGSPVRVPQARVPQEQARLPAVPGASEVPTLRGAAAASTATASARSVAFIPVPAAPPVPPVAPPAPTRSPAPQAPRLAPPKGATAPGRPAPPAPFEATPADGNIRRALGRWARTSGWTFEAEHWAVDVDIPLAGSAAFGSDFVPAVRDLLAATELGDRPLQPCFYANRVLRVVPLAQRCDRTQAPGVPA